ncbi:MAG: aryldialkylphosphatase [Planctomycetota bacterium]
MPGIRTVLGDIDPVDLGVCYAHEHIIIDASYTTQCFPDFRLDSVERAVEELERFHNAGGRAMVDSMPCDSGRNVLKLAAISQATGVHILCPTGLHLAKYYPEGAWGQRLGVDRIADLFIADIEEGIDAHDYAGPICERTPHRAGLIKIASGLDRLNTHEQKCFEAAAIAHARTGAPILTHTEKGTAAIEQVETLQRLGVDPQHVVLSHTDRKPELPYHRDILATGVNVEYDAHFRWKPEQDNPTLDLVVALCKEGKAAQIMLGMDAARRSYWNSYGGQPGMNYLLTTFRDALLNAGVDQTTYNSIMITNPSRSYAFCKPLSA